MKKSCDQKNTDYDLAYNMRDFPKRRDPFTSFPCLEVPVLPGDPSSDLAESFAFGFDCLSSLESLKAAMDEGTAKWMGWTSNMWKQEEYKTDLKAWMTTVPNKMNNAENIKDKRGIISRLQTKDIG